MSCINIYKRLTSETRTCHSPTSAILSYNKIQICILNQIDTTVTKPCLTFSICFMWRAQGWSIQNSRCCNLEHGCTNQTNKCLQIQLTDISDSSGWYTKRQFTFKQTDCFPITNYKLNPQFPYLSNGFPNIFQMIPKFCQNSISVEES